MDSLPKLSDFATDAQPKRRLGRGLAALIGDDPVAPVSSGTERDVLRQIPIELIHANPNNPRKVFAESELEDLARSIRERGLLQPIVVRPRGAGGYEIVAGERRWRAAQLASRHELPAVVRALSDGEALEIALIENVQRVDLNPLEEAKGYQQLVDQFNYTQHQLADVVGKSRSHVSNTLRLLLLPAQVQKYIEDGKLTAGHARTIVATESPNDMAEEIIRLGLSVRQAENLSRTVQKKSPPPPREKDADTRALERELTQAVGFAVTINDKNGAGTVTVSYKTLEQLDDIIQRLKS
jgi:ParB family chromosome partitioning protein